MRVSQRAQRIEPFYVMEMAKSAAAIAREAAGTDRPMIYLNIGEPDFTAPPLVREAAERAIRDGRTQYTQATGLPALRERISDWYAHRFGVQVPARRIVVTAGASAALQLACLALIDAGDEVLMPDPSYPCNRQFVSAAEGRAVLLPATAAERFQLSADKVAAAWGAHTRGVMLASPSNPTGTSIHPGELQRIHDVVAERGGITLIDEIYLGLSYEDTYSHSALGLSDQIISINSFSKYFNMTGWRLGWLVVPDALVDTVEQIAQDVVLRHQLVFVRVQRIGLVPVGPVEHAVLRDGGAGEGECEDERPSENTHSGSASCLAPSLSARRRAAGSASPG